MENSGKQWIDSDIFSFPQLLLPLLSDEYETLHLCPTLMHIHHYFPHTSVHCTQLFTLYTRLHEGKVVWHVLL